MNELRLAGCKPEPLASYLKALGVIRLIAEQGKDPDVLARWNEDQLVLQGNVDQDNLVHFLCEEYRPTPIVSPWNGGSGFYPNDNREAISAIASTENPRLATYRSVIDSVRQWPELPEAFNTPVCILERLQVEVEAARPGRKRDDLLKLVQDVENSRPADAPPNATELDVLETHAKNGPREKRPGLKRWIKTLKKARNRCVSLERGGGKEAILVAARARLPDCCVDWLDVVCALRVDDKPAYNPLLGSGGNDGRLDLSNNFMQHVVFLLLESGAEQTAALARSALYGDPRPGLVKAPIGQYDPGRAGGYNQGAELETKDFKINPWDFVLALEGTLLLAGSVARRAQTGGRALLASPFTVRPSLVGFSSTSEGEKARAETWLPLWTHSMVYRELRQLLGEGRSTLGQGRSYGLRRPARNGLDFTRAVSSLGVDRGIDSFVRFAYLERRGKSYVALPVGRLAVRFRPSVRLLDELDRVLEPLDRFLRQFENVPATLAAARRQIDQALYQCANRGDPPAFQSLVRAVGRMEAELANRDRSKKPALNRPLTGLSPDWVDACDDGSHEVRLAAALASVNPSKPVGSIRSYMAGVDSEKPWLWAKGKGDQTWGGRNLAARLGAVLARRTLDAQRSSAETVPIWGAAAVPCHTVMPFLWGDVDDRSLEELLWGFTLVEWRVRRHAAANKARVMKWLEHSEDGVLSRTWALLKLFFHTEPRRDDVGDAVRDPRIVPLLQARRIKDASAVARRRLMVSDRKPHLVKFEAGELDPERLLASLLVPVSNPIRLKNLVLKENDIGRTAGKESE
jgi:CRISPR-associated protein Csx17